ncbi:hypothetical protein ACWGQ5_02775 [Streptomyces sp. NPDC055722]
MEQRIGSSSQPLDGAGMDPAFIPGLISPVSGEPGDAKPEDPESGGVTQETASDGAVSDAPAAEEKPAGEKEPAEEPEEESPAESEPEGPVFEASDRRARIVADHSGVQLRLDDQECEFRWDEIGALETETSRFGKRFTVTVHTPERRWYPIEIEADSRSRFQEWEARLDEVLDTYFEDGEDKAAVLEKAED